MIPIKDQIAGIIAHAVEFRLKNPGLTVTPEDYAKIAQDIIDRVIDDGQYFTEEHYFEPSKDEGCCLDCTAAHNALWYKLDRLEERFEEEHNEDGDEGNDIHGVLIDEIILLGERIERLEERLDEAQKLHHKHVIPDYMTWTCSNGGHQIW